MRATRMVARVSAGILCLGLISGCGRGDHPETGPVSGRITLDGQPLGEADVYFAPESGGRTSSARTDAEGRYVLLYTGPKDRGAKVGTHRVAIRTAGERLDPATGKSKYQKEKLPKRYHDKSELVREVDRRGGTFDFELTSK